MGPYKDKSWEAEAQSHFLMRVPAHAMVTGAVPAAHVWALLANVDAVQSPLVLGCVIALTPAEAGGTGPRNGTVIKNSIVTDM